ncbi:MAG: hypothetical protein N3D81_04585 [Spirochaetes bacterium]|nr:hypothetical protein [Spirochaetota bacterium]
MMILLVIILSILVLSCNPIFEQQNKLYDKDFLFDDFQTFDTKIWDKREVFIGFSQLKRENSLISNGNLVIVIPANTSDTGGIQSVVEFPRGRFSVYLENYQTNVASELEIYSRRDNLRVSISVFFSSIYNVGVLQYEVVSPLTNITSTYTNNVNLTNKILITVDASYNSIVFKLEGSEVGRVNIQTPREFEVRINTYFKSYDIQYYTRNLYFDYFHYEKN